MFNAQPFSQVSTSFSAEDSAMMPTVSSNLDGVKKMSTSNTMKEVFFEIRDGIVSLSESIKNQTGLLNNTLLGVITTLKNIGRIAADDLDIENQTFDELQEEQAKKDKDTSLKDPDKKMTFSGMLSTLRDGFSSLIDMLTPKSDVAKIGLLGLLALGIGALLPKIEVQLTRLFKFLGEDLLPMLEGLFDVVDDNTGEVKWDKILKMGLGAYVALKIAPAILGLAFRIPGGAKVIGYAALAAWAIGGVFQKAGDIAAAQEWTSDMGATDSTLANTIGAALGGQIEGGAVNAFKNASGMGGTFAVIGAGIGTFVFPVVGTLAGALIGGAIGIVVGGILGFFGGGRIAKFMSKIGTFVSDSFNNMVQGVSNLFYDHEDEEGNFKRSHFGKVKDVMMEDFREMGENIKDFLYDDEGNLFGINFDFLKDLLPSIRQIAATILSYLPNWMRPDSLNEKIVDQQKIIATEQKKLDDNESGVSPLRDIEVRGSNSKIKRAQKKLDKLKLEFQEKYPGLEPGTSELISDVGDGNSIVGNGDGSMVTKIVELKARDRKAAEDALVKSNDGGSFTSISVPKHITNNNAQSTTVVAQKVDGTGSADRILDNFMNQRNT